MRKVSVKNMTVFMLRMSWRSFLMFPLSNATSFVVMTAGLPLAVSWLGLDERWAPLPVALVADVPNILVVNNELPARDLAAFTAHAKANPGKLSYGSTGIGSSMHLAAELFSRETGAQMVHVPYNAPGVATTNLIAGDLQLMFQLVPGIAVKGEAMERAAARGYATATDLADYLVRKGVPFRDAHEAVAHAVKHASQARVGLAELSLATLQGFHPAIASDVHGVLTLRGSLASRKVAGGTAPEQARLEIARHRARLGK